MFQRNASTRTGSGLVVLKNGLKQGLTLGALLFTMTAWLGCRHADVSDSGGAKGAQASDEKKPAGETLLGEGGTLPKDSTDTDPLDGFIHKCTDKSPAELGIAFKCTTENAPVCGCDGKTYTNGCQAAGIGGVWAAYAGACKPIK